MVEVNKTLSPSDNMPQTMWIVFTDETDLWFLKGLKNGFRHCFLVTQQDNRWILIDPRSDKTDIQILPHPHHFNLPRYFIGQGNTVVKIPALNTPKRIASVLPISCVEIIKRVIGLHQWWVITPRQLYSALIKYEQKEA